MTKDSIDKELAASLQKIGIDGLEAQILLLLLKEGKGLYSHEIVTMLNGARVKIDRCLDRMIKEGHITKVSAGKRFKFYAIDPDLLIRNFKERIEIFKNNIEGFIASNIEKEDVQLAYYSGDEGVIKAYASLYKLFDEVETKEKKIFVLGYLSEMAGILPAKGKTYSRKRKKNKIEAEIMIPRVAGMDEVWESDAGEMRETRFVDGKDLPDEVMIETYHDTVILYSFDGKEKSAFSIKNKKVADITHYMLSFVWDTLEE